MPCLASLGSIDTITDNAPTQALVALVPKLPATPPRNLRRLLELYADLVARTGRPVPAAVQGHLGEWRSAAALKKVLNNLLAPAATLVAS